jgi:type VI secretion system secreted protein Hcp
MSSTAIKVVFAASALVAGLTVSARDAHAAVDAFLKFESPTGTGAQVPSCAGESQDPTYKGWLEIKNFSFGVENPVTIGSATGGAGAGKAKFQTFSITKTVDSSSTCLARVLAYGGHFGKVTIDIRKAGAGPNASGKPYLEFIFGTVFVSKQQWSGPGDQGPQETVEFAYGAMKINYFQQSPSGQMAATPSTFTWDQVTNREGSL